jgi:hypothetical protein
MSDVDLGQVAATAWEAVVGEGPTDNIFTSQALLYLLGKNGFKEEVSGGRLFEMTVEYAKNSSFKSYGETEQLDTVRYDVFDAARYDQRFFFGTVVFSDVEQLRNAVQNRKIDVIKSKIKNGISSASQQLNDMLFGDGTGNGGKDFDGLKKIIPQDPTTGTVGTINAATWTFWRSKAVDGTKSSTIYDNLRASMTTCFNDCSLGGVDRTPTGAISDQATFEGYEGLLVDIERLVKDTGNGKAPADVAFLNRAIRFKGIPYVYGEDANANAVYLVNNNFLKLCYLKGAWLKMKDPVEPADQMTIVHKVLTVGNLASSARRHLGTVYNTAS